MTLYRRPRLTDQTPKKLSREEHSAQIIEALKKVQGDLADRFREIADEQKKSFFQKYGPSIASAVLPLALVVVPWIVTASVRFDRVERSTDRISSQILELDSVVAAHIGEDAHSTAAAWHKQISRDLARIEKGNAKDTARLEKAIEKLSDKIDQREQ